MLPQPTEPQPPTARHELVQLDGLDPVRCPCGWARRAFAEASSGRISVHLVSIETDSRTHYHRHLTEIYLVLQGTGQIELDGVLHPVQPLTAILIKPGCRHRAIGQLTLLNIVQPAFDPDDEWFD